MIQVKNINKSFGNLQVLKDINLNVKTGEILSIVGPSGAGKTTLLQIMGTLDSPDSGEIRIKDIDVLRLKDKKIAKFRNEYLGFVFQFHHLLPEFTALENVMIPAMIAEKKTREIKKEAADLLNFLGLSDRLEHKPNELSGGEQQRVAVARALINKPAVLFADEPSGNLDSQNADELHKLFFNLRDEFQQTIVVVTHNEELANMSDRKITMKDGRIIA